MRRIAAATLLLSWAGLTAPAAAPSALESSVVGLVVTHQKWDPDRPWAKRNPGTRDISGVFVEGPYILTNSRMIEDATFIQAERYGMPTRTTARPVFVDRDVNLALLEIDDPGFFTDLRPVRLAKETPTRGVLRTVRWKGQQLESLASRVKRFEVQKSYLGELQHVFLLAQTDLTGGGWAEPVFDDGGRLVGITVSQDEQQARIVPVEIISKFLERVRAPGPYRSFPFLGANWQINTNPDLAAYLGQTGRAQGVVIRQVPWGSSACGVLKPGDILLSIDGVAIDAEGFYTHPRLGRLEFSHLLIEEHEPGDVVGARVIREGRELDLEMTLRNFPAPLMLIPKRYEGEPPPYVIAGGLVMRQFDLDYLMSWGSEWNDYAPLHLKTLYYMKRQDQRPDRRRIILLTSILPAPYNAGYQNLADAPVESINGRPVDSIPDVVEAFRHPVDGFHTVVLAPNSSRREIVLDAALFDQATAEIVGHYRIPQASRMPSAPLPDGGPDCPGDS